MKKDIFFVREKNSTNVHIHKIKRFLLENGIKSFYRLKPQLVENKLSDVMYRPSKYRPKENEISYFENAKSSLLYIGEIHEHIKIYRFGKGPKIILQHGWASSAYQLTSVIKELVDHGFEVITFDHAGHGESTGEYTSYFEFIKTVDALYHHFTDIYGLIGHSLGSASTVYLSTKYQAKLKVVLLAPHYNVKENLFSWTKEAGVPEEVTEKIISKRLDMFGLDYEKITPSNLIKKSKHKFLVIHDENDTWVNFSNAEAVIRDKQDAKLITTHGLGHNKILKDPKVLTDIISFMQNQEV